MESMAEVFDVDLPELLDDEAVVLIEWGEAIVASVPADYLEIELLASARATTTASSSCARRGPGGRTKVVAARPPWTAGGTDAPC